MDLMDNVVIIVAISLYYIEVIDGVSLSESGIVSGDDLVKILEDDNVVHVCRE